MYIERSVTPHLAHLATKYPVIAILGPRQSGKTSLAEKTFPNHAYFSLENPNNLAGVREDPAKFLNADYGAGVIIDEFQHEPQLLSYIQGIVDSNYRPGYFILTGSHNFLMNEQITQSLAGRVGILRLLPFSCEELAAADMLPTSLDKTLLNGGYPAVYARDRDAQDLYSDYVHTYVERDVRQLINVMNLSAFQKFLRLCAGRIGQLVDYSSLADDCGISVPTVKAWLSVLEASYIVFLLQPHFANFNKRLVKSPKLYFYDTGLACFLLKITSEDMLNNHYLRGGLFESFAIAEIHKKFFNQRQFPSTYFWRDSSGHEVDCLIDYGTKLIPIEVKSTSTYNARFFEKLSYYCQLSGMNPEDSRVVYGGQEEWGFGKGSLVSWKNVASLVVAR